MTKKHFKALAEALCNMRPAWIVGAELTQWLSDVKAISEVCQKFNEKFDTDRFFVACGIGGKK